MSEHFQLAPVETSLLSAEQVAVVRFNCPAEHPHFRGTGPLRTAVIGFPRRATRMAINDGPMFVADRNAIVVLNRGDSYRREVLADDRDESDVFGITDALLADLLAELAPAWLDRHGVPRLPALPQSVPAPLILRVRRLVRAMAAGEARGLMAEAAVVELLAEICRQFVDKSPADVPLASRRLRMQAAIEQVKALLNAGDPQQLSLAELAAQVHLSPFHLCRNFKAVTGLPIHRYGQQLLLARALDLLEQGHWNLQGVARKLNFASHSHLTVAFRQCFGVTPKRAFDTR